MTYVFTFVNILLIIINIIKIHLDIGDKLLSKTFKVTVYSKQILN